MVTDTFQIFCNHQKIHTGIGVFFAFFQAGNQFLFHQVEKLINLIVSLIKFFCLLFISCHKKLYPITEDLSGLFEHLRHGRCILFVADAVQTHCHICDIRCMVTDTFQIFCNHQKIHTFHVTDCFHNRRYDTQITCQHRLLPGQKQQTFCFNLTLHLIDLTVIFLDSVQFFQIIKCNR